ncbi:MAG: 16S rRNA (cytidine(1402)-2'-O)-methyltransferase [bacterium]
MTPGTLYLVATPIGNLEDITLRALRILKEVDLIACEDTRRTQLLLRTYDVRSKLISYYGAKEKEKSRELLKRLKEGKNVALVSDAGMPGISDPGALIVKRAVEEDIVIVPIPGPSAGVAALAASGLEASRFVFEGFLPKKGIERKKRLAALAQERNTIIFFESPQRLIDTLRDMRAIMGERRAVIARELTKLHEEFVRGLLGGLIERMEERGVRGEVVIMVEGSSEQIDWERIDIPAYIGEVQERMGLDRMSAIKLVAHLSGIGKSELYRSIQIDKFHHGGHGEGTESTEG